MRFKEFTIRRLTTDDVADAMRLKNLAGWNQTEADWLAYLAYEPEGCFAAEIEGRVVGTSTAIAYEKRFGWVGMVLVDPDHRRRGLGTRLLGEGIEYLKAAGVETVKLDATPMGRQVYVPMGFRDEYALERRQGRAAAAPPPDGVETGPATEHFEAVARLDAEAFGADRRRVIERLFNENPERARVAIAADRVEGYIVMRPGHDAWQIGPWVARESAAAEALFVRAMSDVVGEPLFFDVVPSLNPAAAVAERCGFTVQRPFTRMYLGSNRHPGRPELVWATSGAEKG
jgi:predicted N-acetyltransferase YhbS